MAVLIGAAFLDIGTSQTSVAKRGPVIFFCTINMGKSDFCPSPPQSLVPTGEQIMQSCCGKQLLYLCVALTYPVSRDPVIPTCRYVRSADDHQLLPRRASAVSTGACCRHIPCLILLSGQDQCRDARTDPTAYHLQLHCVLHDWPAACCRQVLHLHELYGEPTHLSCCLCLPLFRSDPDLLSVGTSFQSSSGLHDGRSREPDCVFASLLHHVNLVADPDVSVSNFTSPAGFGHLQDH